MTRFDSATMVAAVGEGRYTAELDPGYLIGRAINGGYLMAIMQRAALIESPHAHAVSSSYHFLRPGTAGPAEIDVAVLKAGRTVATVQVTARQNGAALVTGTIATATMDPSAVPVYEAEPAPVPPIEECVRFDPRAGQISTTSFIERVDQYYTQESWDRINRRAADPVPELVGHVRLSEVDGRDNDDPSLFLPLAVDSLPPLVVTLASWRWAPTVELTWHMRAIPEPGPLTFRSRAAAVNDGWFDETVDLWDTKGRLVAQSRQLARSSR